MIRDDESSIYPAFHQKLEAYARTQGTETDREVALAEPPWPNDSSEMLAYLLARAKEMMSDDSVADPTAALGTAITWLAVTAWFEGGLAERARQRGWSE